MVEDLSSMGFRIPTEAGLQVGAFVSLGLAGVAICPARVVLQANGQIGCMFLVPIGQGELKTAMDAISLRPIDLDRTALARLPEPEGKRVSGTRAPKALRIFAVTGLAAASWAAAIGVANLLTK